MAAACMAAAAAASASSSSTSEFSVETVQRTSVYDRQVMLSFSKCGLFDFVNLETRITLQSLGLLRQSDPEVHRGAESPTTTDRPRRHRSRCERKQKRGCRGGLAAKLKANPFRSPLPSILLANTRSLESQLDSLKLDLITKRETRNCCILIFTETWLNSSVPEAAVSLDGLTTIRADRSHALTGKPRGGGLCMYTNNSWCNNATLVSSHCSADIEFMMVRCRPFYLPREFTVVIVVAVYIPPRANTKHALTSLHSAISDMQSKHPEGVFIAAGDFNQANVNTVLPKFHQHVDFATRGENTLDLEVYTNIEKAFRATPRPFLGSSDHLSVMLLPAYQPLVTREKPAVKKVRVWPEGAMSALQDCFECTDWDMFREAATDSQHTDVEEYAASVTGYIQWCMEEVTVEKTIVTRANQKPWMTKEVRTRLRERNAAFKSGDALALRTARANLNRAIKAAKHAHSQKMQGFLHDPSNSRQLGQGVQTVTDHKATPSPCPDDISFLNELNNFFGRFEVLSNTPARRATPHPDEQALRLETTDVRRALRKVNAQKASGPDNIPGRLIKECADQLAHVLTDIFNASLVQAVVPPCFKSATIIPVPKTPT
uniref:uncharacterized protein LOC122769872 n=1 Tax=Solea senegalensis TaxID=28829 RepID=UPI001CD8C9D7|nr:uncharacterized protein LOC122769872 [Solea senegalensis]